MNARPTGPDRTAIVYLNGKIVDNVLVADEVNGVVVRIAFDCRGKIMCDGDHIMSVTQYGIVRVMPKG